MRITSFTIFNQLTRSLHENMRIMGRLSNRLATGKKINSPSEDVTGMMKAMDYKLTINELEQYIKNIDEANAYLSFAETTMSSVTNVLTRARELAVQGANGSLNSNDRISIAKEVGALRDELLSLANSKLRNRYIFSGFDTDTAAFDSNFNYQGDSGEIKVMIDRSTTMAINIPGDTVFGDGSSSFMGILDQLYDDLTNNSQSGIQSAITNIDNALDEAANVRADIGARLNHLDDLKKNLGDKHITIKTFLSETEDTDIAETVSELSKTEVALQSLRRSGAEILSQSLLDFLR